MLPTHFLLAKPDSTSSVNSWLTWPAQPSAAKRNTAACRHGHPSRLLQSCSEAPRSAVAAAPTVLEAPGPPPVATGLDG